MQKSNRQAESTLRIPPQNEEAEQTVLASLMIEDRSFDKVAGIIMASDFYNPNNGIIFEHIARLFDSGNPYDVSFVVSSLRSSGDLERVGGVEHLAGLARIIPNAANIERYAKVVKDKSRLRQLIRTATTIQETAYEYDRDITLDTIQAVDESEQMILEIAKDTSDRDLKEISGFIAPIYEELERLSVEGQNVAGLPSGFYDLDHYTNGLQAGALIVIAGRPGMGKTSFALNIAQNVAKTGKSVAMFSLEMTSNQLVQRIMSSEAEVNSRKILTGQGLDAEDWEKLASIGDELSNMKIFLDDTSNISVMEIRSKCRRLKSNKEHGLDLVIIDYLQLMENKRIEQREQQIADISRNLKGLAKELEVPVIALSQLNRSVESRTDKRPQLSDLRESGAIEQDADIIIFVYRDEVYNKGDSAHKGIAEILVSKNRSGSTGVARLGFTGAYTKFRNLDRSSFT